MPAMVISGIRPSFPGLSQSQGQVAHVLLTRSPLEYPRRGLSARLACVKHAASVRPEPGSNSPSRPHDHPRTKPRAAKPQKKIPANNPRKDRIASKKSPTNPENEDGHGATRPTGRIDKGTGF